MIIFIKISVAIFLLFLLILYEAKWKDIIRSHRLRIALTAVIAIIIAPTIYSLISDWSNRTERQKEEEFRNAVLEAIVDRETDIDGVSNLIRLKYREVFDSSDEEAEKWAKDFFQSLDWKQARLAELERAGDDLSRLLMTKWQPFIDYVLLCVDDRVQAISKRTELSVISNEDYNLLDKEPGIRQVRVREISFPSGAVLGIDVHRGRIERGVLVRPPLIIFREQLKGNEDIIFYLSLQPDCIRLHIDNKHAKAMQNRKLVKLEDNLLSNQNREAIHEVINHAMQWLFLSG